MSLFRINEFDSIRQKKLKKVISHQPVTNNNSGGLPNECKQGDSARENSKQKLINSASKASSAAGQMGDAKLPPWHYLMEQAFENFLLRLDEIFLTLKRKDASPNGRLTNVKSYQNICQKLRMEILIAMDKLELMSMPTYEHSQDRSEFLNKMDKLKTQLSELRWQYHNAINDLGAKML